MIIDYSTLTAKSDTLIDYWIIRNNQLFISICKKWHLKCFLKHLQWVHQWSPANETTLPSFLPYPSSLPQPPLFPRDPPAAAPACTAGILADIPSRPGDLVDSLTRSDSFVFLSELFDNKRLFELRDFRIARVMPKGEAVDQFATSMHLVLDLADKYPRDSLTAHILDYVDQFLPALICPCTRRDRVRQIISSAKRFQLGDWKDLWETALRLAQRATDTTVKCNHNRVKRDTLSIQTRVVYAEHCARRGALSKANQVFYFYIW